MAPLDVIVLALIAVAFVAVCVRVHRKGACADCAQSGSCSGHGRSGRAKRCPALKGVDRVANELGRDVR